ncbi:MAG: glycoside hydrolase family 65 protein [Lachnospiraceae bacterium]|nr:glycoside hydrolase family 65 protein [Lachnospiraceae bacterium]
MELKEPIYPVEPWTITEQEFKKETNYRNETTFALSNGYLGSRGTFEEGYGFTPEEGLEGNFINGFYESETIRYGEWNYGFPLTSQSLLNLPNMKTTYIFLGDEKLDLFKGKIISYQRKLHMKEGYVSRETVWQSPEGKEVKLYTERFCSMDCKNLMVMKIQITPLNFSGRIQVKSLLEGQVENHTRITNPLVDYGPFGPHLDCDEVAAQGMDFYFEGTTKNSKLSMACMGRHEITQGLPVNVTAGTDKAKTLAVINLELEGREKETVVIHKYLAYTSSLDMPRGEMKDFLQETLSRARGQGAEKLKENQTSYMKSFWEKADIRIEGDDRLQQGIRFNLFHIMQAAGRDGRTGMGAKGLTGEGYEGHYFWDTEMYVLPVFVYTDEKLAKALLDYRYDTLNEARDRARVLGHEKGALYPWRTINGKEASTYFPLGTAQYHINGDIAYAFRLYMDVSGDYEYLEKKGAEVLIETARVYADVGDFAESRGGKYCICAVTGPDEYNAIVDNNFYTNLMARENLKSALWALDTIKEKNPRACEELVNRLKVTDEEILYWKKIIDNMYFPYDEQKKIYPLDDGFLMRKRWDESKIPEEKRHLLYENYHPLFIFRQRMSKQADAILGMLLYSNYFTDEELKRNYDFYQQVTLHHSSLSTCIFGIMASQIGYGEEAYEYFSQSARMDLDDYHNNFYAGIHAANMAGTWQGIVFGFAGLRTNNNRLEFHPSLPQKWKSYTFSVHYQGSVIEVHTQAGRTVYKLINDVPVTIHVDGEAAELRYEGDCYEKI